MALGRDGANAITYTPFNKTSFGYPNNQIQTDQPTLTNVKVTIFGFQGNWDTTGHISTPSSGSAVSTFDKLKNEWICEGPVADVDAVLDTLDFFPADNSAIRNWTATTWKANDNGGSYINENPAETVAIPDTTMHIQLRNPDNSYAFVSEEIVRFTATQPEFGKQRPYWSVEPQTQDLNAAGYGGVSGDVMDLGTILQGSDTDNLQVKCQFRDFGTSTINLGNGYGYFTADTNMFVGDKKPGTRDQNTSRLDFTGSLAEVQAYLDTIRYYDNQSTSAFDMYLTVSNGQVGSYVTKTCYFSNAPFTVSTFPGQVGQEETTFTFSLPTLTFTAQPVDVNQYSYTMTFDATGIDGIDTIGGGALAGTGIYTSANFSSVELMRADIDALQLTFRDDFDDTFNFDITYTGGHSTVGTSYTTASQTVQVIITGTNEISDLISTHSWTEDTSYNLNTGTVVQIAHGYNSDFECRFEISDTNAGVLSATASGSGTATWTSPNLLFVGTRDEVNAMLLTTKFIPNPDYDSNFTLEYRQKRVSGDTTSNSGNNDYYNIEIGAAGAVTMNVTAHDDFSISQATNLAWFEDVNMTFDSGLQITDLADTNADLTTYQSNYRVEIAMWYGISEYTDGTIVSNYTTNLTVGGVGNQNGQGDTNMISYTGPKADINTALADLRFIPNPDFDGQGPYVFYKIVRVQDGAELVPQGNSTRTEFAVGTGHDDYSHTRPNDLSWNEDTATLFDTGTQITDLADENGDYSQLNSTYTAALELLSWDAPFTAITTASIDVLSTITGYSNLTITTSGSGITISGPKTDVNTALQNLKMIPDMDWLSSPASNGKFFTWIDLTRDSDSVVLVDGSASNVWIGFEEGTDSTEYVTSVSGMSFEEDTPKTIFNGLTVGITDAAADNFPNITYEVTLSLSDDGITAANTAGEWTGTGSHIKVLTGTKASVNADIQALSFTPTIDYSTDFHVLYTQKRYVSGSLNQTHVTDGDLGTVTATASPLGNYYTSMTGATWTEDINNQYIFSGHNIGVTDIAADNYANITYEVTVSVPSAVGTFDTNSTGTYTITDTKANVNTALQNLAWSPAVADDFTSFDVTYTQKRYIGGVLDTTHANAVNIGQVTGVNVAEFTYGTGNSNIQYMVEDGTTPNTVGQVLSPFQLTTNHPSKFWSQPITITDTYEDGGASEYKIVFTVPAGTTLYDNTDTSFAGTLDWDTKANIHTKLSKGIRISGATANLSLAFELFRKTATNTEASLGTGSLSYTYIPIMNIGVASGGELYGMGGQNATQNAINAGAYSDVDMSISVPSEMSSISFSNLGSYLTYESGGFKISNSLPNSTIHTSDITVISNFGIKLSLTGVKFNMTRVHTSPFTYNSSDAIPTRIQATDRLLGPNSPQLMHQSNYWDGTYMQVGQQAVEQDGTLLHYTDDRSDRFEDEFTSSPTQYSYLGGYNRALVSGPQGYFYGFKLNRDSSTGDVEIEVISKTNTNNGAWVPGAGNTMPSATVKSAYDTRFTQTGWEQFCYVQDIKYDSANQDIYALCILNVGPANAYAVIMKLHYDGVATGIGSHTSYAWSVVKEIQLRNSSEYYFIEAYLSNDYETLVTMQTEADDFLFQIDETVTSNNVFRVYDKDQGGTNNWGQVVSNTYTSATTGHMATRKNNFWHDVNYCAYDGVDTFITADGYKTYRANQGGTNNWGEVTTSLYQPYGIYKFTQDYLFFAGSEGVQLFDKSTLTALTPNYDNVAAFNDDYFPTAAHGGNNRKITSSGTVPPFSSSATGTFFGNNGRFSHNMVEASLSHNMVGVYVLVDEVTWDGTFSIYPPYTANITYTGDGEIIWKMYHLQT